MSIQQLLLGAVGPAYYNPFTSSGTLSDFTASNSAGGTTWAIAAGALAASGGSANQCYLLQNANPFADGMVLASITSGDQVGLVLRASDFNNNYLFAVRDASSSVFPDSYQVYKYVGGAFAELTSGATGHGGWTRGTAVTWKFEAVGTSLKVYKNGALINTFVDSSLTSGKAGVYTYGALVNSFDDFTIQT